MVLYKKLDKLVHVFILHCDVNRACMLRINQLLVCTTGLICLVLVIIHELPNTHLPQCVHSTGSVTSMQSDYWFNFVGARMFKLKKCLKLLIYFISFGLFMTIVLELVSDVLQEPTGTTIQIDEYEYLQLPAFTICTEKAYKVPTDYVLHSIEQFDKATFSIEDIFQIVFDRNFG